MVRTDYAGARNLQEITLVIPKGVDRAVPGVHEQYLEFFDRHVGKQKQDVEISRACLGIFERQASVKRSQHHRRKSPPSRLTYHNDDPLKEQTV